MNIGPATTKAREAVNAYFQENPDCDILSENILYTTTVAQKTVVIILLRIRC